MRHPLFLLSFLAVGLCAAVGCAHVGRGCFISESEAAQYPDIKSAERPHDQGKLFRLRGVLYASFERAGIIPFADIRPEEAAEFEDLAYCFGYERCIDAIESVEKTQDKESLEEFGTLLRVDAVVRLLSQEKLGHYGAQPISPK